MFGRAEEFEWLSQRLSSVDPGPPRVILLEGPMGQGKTFLIMTVLAHSETQVFLTRGDRFVEASPLSSARPIVEQVFATDLDDVMDQYSVATIIRRCVAAVRAEPSIVVVDDAQWTDSTSLQLFAALMPHATNTLLAHRPGQAPVELLQAVRSSGATVEELVLGPLADEAVDQLVADLPAPQRDLVVTTAAGSPLFARTLHGVLRRQRGASRIEDVLRLRPGSPSDALSSAVRADLEMLSPRERLILTAIAVLGRAHPEHIACLVDIADVDTDLHALREHGLLMDTSSEPLHPLVRYTAHQSMDPLSRATLIRRAAALPGTDALARAEHLALLGPLATEHDVDQLLESAALVLDTDPSVVERWLSSTTHLSSPRRDLLQARAQVLMGDSDQAAAALERLRDHPEHGPEAVLLRAHSLRMSGRPEEALELLTMHGSEQQPELLLELVATAIQLDLPRTKGEALEALVAGPEPYRSAAAALRTIGLLNVGDVGAARTEFEAVATTMLTTVPRELRDVLDAVTTAAWCAYMLEDFQHSILLAERGLRVARRFGRANVQPGLNCVLAYALIQVGRLEDADAAADTAVETGERFRVPDIVSMARNALVLAAFWWHDPDLMRQRLDVLRDTPLPAVSWWRRTVESSVARSSAMLGEHIVYVLVTDPADAMTPLRHADAATIAMFNGDQPTARRLLEEGRRFGLRHGLESQSAFLGLLLAGVMGAEDLPGAIAILEESQEVHARLAMPLHLELGRTQLAELRIQAAATVSARLSARELEVARHVVRGATNQEIADELVLSRRTVEEHVSNILRKLDLRSRHAVARVLEVSDGGRRH